MEQTKVTATKGAEAGGASATGVPQRISHAEISQMDHFEGWRVVYLGHLEEWAGVMPTSVGLPVESADRIRTQPSSFGPA